MANVYNRSVKRFLDSILTAQTKALLVNTSYVFSKAHDVVSEVVAFEVAGTGYTGGFSGSGRKTLASRANVQDDGLGGSVFDAADLVWTAINVGAVGGVILWRPGTVDGDSELIAFLNGGFPKTTNGGDLNVQWSAAGIIQGV